jgi:hypothetical protein
MAASASGMTRSTLAFRPKLSGWYRSVSDRTDLLGLHDVFHAILGWSGDLGYLVRIHGQEFNSFRRSTRSKALRDFQLHRQEKFLYVCDVMDLWELDVRVLDIQQGIEDDH